MLMVSYSVQRHDGHLSPGTDSATPAKPNDWLVAVQNIQTRSLPESTGGKAHPPVRDIQLFALPC